MLVEGQTWINLCCSLSIGDLSAEWRQSWHGKQNKSRIAWGEMSFSCAFVLWTLPFWWKGKQSMWVGDIPLRCQIRTCNKFDLPRPPSSPVSLSPVFHRLSAIDILSLRSIPSTIQLPILRIVNSQYVCLQLIQRHPAYHGRAHNKSRTACQWLRCERRGGQSSPKNFQGCQTLSGLGPQQSNLLVAPSILKLLLFGFQTDFFSPAVASTLIFGVISLHILYPESRIHTRKFLQLSYPSQTENVYTQGLDDIYYVVAWVINFTALRAVSIEWILQPLAGSLGVVNKNRLRFAEQGWLVLYYSIFWTLGMVCILHPISLWLPEWSWILGLTMESQHLWYNSVYWLNNAEIWTAWPAREMSGVFKWYYLVQLAFWVQQILVIHIEARRKDHAQMLTHHIITCTLISITYVYRYTRAANVVLCLMDVVDLIFPVCWPYLPTINICWP